MKILSIPLIASVLALARLAFGSYIQHAHAVEVAEDVGDHDTHMGPHGQPKYTGFLDEHELGNQERHPGMEKRGYYTCYNRQVGVYSPLSSSLHPPRP